MFLADFHVHSNFSDGKHSIPEVVDLYGKRGFGAISITDHLCDQESFLGKASRYLGCTLTTATFPLYMEILRSEAQRAWERYQMVVIPGVELTKNSLSNHRSAHIIGIGITDYVCADGDVGELADRIRAQGAISVAAHPVWTRLVEKQSYHLWDRREELKSRFDAWEIASGRYIFDEVRKSNLPVIASSDLHHARQISSWKTVLRCERRADAILDAIRKQELGLHFYEEEWRHGNFPRPTFPLGLRNHADSVGHALRA